MGDHELMHAAPAMYNGGGGGGVGAGGAASHHGMWWSTAAVPATAAACSTELAGFSTWPSALAAAASYDVAAAKSCTTARASSESPGNNSSITFQEPTPIPDPAAVPQPALAGFIDWNHPFMNGGANLHGSFLQVGQQEYMSSSRNDHMNASSLMNPSSNNLDLALQGHHEQQLLSNLGAELLLSPTSPYGFQSSLLRSLMEPAGKPALPGLSEQYQQQQYQHMGGQSSPAVRFAPAGASREPLQFTNDTPYWNSSAGFGMAAVAAPAANQAGARTAKPSPAPRAASKMALKNVLEGVGDSSSVVTKKGNSEPAFKKPRLETPSPLPTFKVRKEKLGDRVTALQQLVSPFGKTDTASVLYETIEYIKFLHDQVGVLSAPYLKNGHHQHQVPQYLKSSSGSPDKSCKDGEVSLKGRGLCLVPISSTFAVASEVPVDFWTPFGANFR